MRDRLYSKLIALPFVGYVLRLFYGIARYPRHLDEQRSEFFKLSKNIDNMQEQLVGNQNTLEEFDSRISDLTRQITILNKKGSDGHANNNNAAALVDDHLLDKFYLNFENRFRGDEGDILERQKVYIPYFKKLHTKLPVLDIGCGRGEFLEVLKVAGLDSIGLDLNGTMVERVRAKGFEAVEDDALSYLLAKKGKSLAAITGFHIVEHIQFGELIRIFQEAYRTLENGGFVLFETPNPENVSVGSHTFYLDPSHLKPVPPALLAFTLEFCGFSKCEIIRLHPEKENDSAKKSKDIRDLNERVFGPRDYAVIGYR